MLDRLNIDIQIQIKEITINIDSNSTSIVFSTTKDYIGIGQKNLGRFFSSAAYNLKNNLGYYEDQWNTGKNEAKQAFTKVTEGYEINNLNIIEAGGLSIGGSGGELASCVVNPLDDEVVCTNKSDIARLIVFGFVRIDRGRIDVFNRDAQGQVVNAVVVSPTGVVHSAGNTVTSMSATGFKIKHNTTDIFSVDELGNAFFNGTVSVGTITGLGDLATADTVAAGDVTGLGSLATQNSVNYASITGTKPPTNADATATVISGGLVTTGTLQVIQGGTVAAGITGNTSGDTAVRFFAGSTLANRASAPFRVTQAGNLVATNANITGTITANSGKIGN